MNRIERIDQTRIELLDQPSALRKTLIATREAAERLAPVFRSGQHSIVYIVGSGDSLMVGEAVAAAWEEWLGVPVIAMQALEFARQRTALINSRTLVVAISASGSSWATEQALDHANRLGAMTVGISGVKHSPLLERAQHALLVPATRVGWPTQSTTSQIAGLLQLGLEFSGRASTEEMRALDALPDLVEGVLEAEDSRAKNLAERLQDRTEFFFAASGAPYAAARMGAAKVKEMSQDHASAMFMEEYHHYVSVKRGEVLFLLVAGDRVLDRAKQTAHQAREDGVDLIVVTDSHDRAITEAAQELITLPVSPSFVHGIVFALPLQLFSQHLAVVKKTDEWALQNHQGRTPHS